MNKTLVLMIVMALVTYLVRMIPFVLMRKKVENKFLQSMLYYMPYTILVSMTIPAIFYATDDIRVSLVGCIVALVLALWNKGMVLVSISASAASLIAYLLIF